jgi:nicotinamide phosphoribosyltransferase
MALAYPNPIPNSDVNPILIADSYKISQQVKMYDSKTETLIRTYAHVTPRVGKSGPDHVVAVGQMHTAALMASMTVKPEHIAEAHAFSDAHFGPGVFSEAPWKNIISNGGKIPMIIKALPEGTVVPRGVPIMIIESTSEASTVPFFEGQLQRIHYPTSVATRANEYRTVVNKWLNLTVDPDLIPIIFPSRIHDFGVRACPSEEAAKIGGMAALEAGLGGTDNVPGTVYTMKLMPNTRMPAHSVPADEHNGAMSRGEDGEFITLEIVLDAYPTGYLSYPIDTYNTMNFIDKVTLPGELRSRLMARNGTFVMRPDSALINIDGSKMSHGETIRAIFNRIKTNLADLSPENGGINMNSLGYQVLPNWLKIIYGDSVTVNDVNNIYTLLAMDKWSAENIVYGVGGNLLQVDITRGWLDFAMKCSQQTYRNNTTGEIIKRDVCKKTPGKVSPAGRIKVITRAGRIQMVPEDDGPEPDMMVVYYKDGELFNFESLETVRERVKSYVGF